MATRTGFGAVVGGLGLVLSTTLMSIAVTPPRVGTPPAVTTGAPWTQRIAHRLPGKPCPSWSTFPVRTGGGWRQA